MFAYCLNNPVISYDPTGTIGLISFLFGLGILTTILLIPSSEQQEPTQAQIDAAKDAADRAEISVRKDETGKPHTVDISIDMKDAIDSVDIVAYECYYEELYDRTVEKAKAAGVPMANLMTIDHIRWEFSLHAFAYKIGIPNAIITDLNVEETLWSMFERLW